jgi:hypothetical protein
MTIACTVTAAQLRELRTTPVGHARRARVIGSFRCRFAKDAPDATRTTTSVTASSTCTQR